MKYIFQRDTHQVTSLMSTFANLLLLLYLRKWRNAEVIYCSFSPCRSYSIPLTPVFQISMSFPTQAPSNNQIGTRMLLFLKKKTHQKRLRLSESKLLGLVQLATTDQGNHHVASCVARALKKSINASKAEHQSFLFCHSPPPCNSCWLQNLKRTLR